MSNDSLSSILRALCEDGTSARALLGNPSFLKICAALAEQMEEQFRQATLLENAARRPDGYAKLDGSYFRNRLYDGLDPATAQC
jgi:hypothetical protein